MKLSLLRPMGGARRRRAALILSGALAILALSAVMASSASAFAWWIGNPEHPEELMGKLPINPEGTVHQPITFRWLKNFEVQCKGITYNKLFLEGPVFMGAESFSLEQCVAKKPKKATLIGGKIVTTELHGEIKPGGGSSVAFVFEPVGGTLTKFTLEATLKRKHHRMKKCTFEVEAIGNLSGTLGKPEKISEEKTFEFAPTTLLLKQSRTCVPAAKVPAAKAKRRGPNRFSKTGLVLKTAAGKLAPGSELRLFSSNLTFATEVGNTECEENILSGTLNTNGGGKDGATIAHAQATGDFEGIPGACKSSAGPDFVQANAPWQLILTSTGAAAITGKPISLTSRFPGLGELECTYEALILKGTNTTTGPLVITITEQPLKRSAKSSQNCPALAKATGTFTVSSAGEPVEAEQASVSKEQEEKEREEEEEEAERPAEEAEEEAEEKGGTPEKTKGKSSYGGTPGWGVL